MKTIYYFNIIIVFVFFACTRVENRNVNENTVVLNAELNLENDTLNIEKTRRLNNAHSGKYYSSTDSISKYGVGFCKTIPDSLFGYNLSVYISVWVRESLLPVEGEIAVSLNVGDKLIDWKSIKQKDIAYKQGKWIQIKDSLFYPSKLISQKKTFLKVFAMKDSGKDSFDVDDLIIKFKFSK